MRFVTAVLTMIVGISISALDADDNWPQFRGHRGLGIGSGTPPVTWNVKTGENIAWKTPLAGLGLSSPVVWGNRIFLTTAVNSETDKPSLQTGWLGGTGKSPDDKGEWTWQVLCIALDTGQVLWTRDAHHGKPLLKRHLKASHANCTAVTDGQHVVAFFGSEGLYCYDIDGTQLWKREFGKLHSGPYDEKELEWGFASSPVIHDGAVVIQCDCLNAHFVAALDIATGEELGRIDREDEVSTWSTPLIIQTDDGEHLICNGYRQMAGYDLRSGEKRWHLNGGGDIPVPTPLFADGLVYLTNGHGKTPIYVIEVDAQGDLTPTSGQPNPDGLAWWAPKDGAYMPTPLVKDGVLYTCNDNGRLSVRDARNGDVLYRQRVGTGSRTYSASAVAAGGHVYFASERGEVTVIKEGRTYEKVGGNEMAEVVMATPAIAGDRLLIRTLTQLVCVEQSEILPEDGERKPGEI